MADQEPLSIYLDDPQADTWFWEYHKDVDEWQFFADDYEPANSVKIIRTQRHGIYPVVRRDTTMPTEVRAVIMQSGLALFEKSDAGIMRVPMNMTVIMRATDEVLATIERMKTDAD